jgi:phage terminase Nu1 subunit (DNA packaging protein)
VAAKNKASANPVDVVTPPELGQILALSQKEIDVLVRSSVLVRSAAVINKRHRVVFDWRDNVRRYCIHMRKPREEARDAYADEKRLTQNIVRQQKELELAIARGDMIRRSKVLLTMTGMLSTVKNHVLAIPSRCTRQLVGQRDPNKVRRILDDACRDSLRETKDFGAHSFDETSKNGTQNGGENTSGDRLRQRIRARRRRTN